MSQPVYTSAYAESANFNDMLVDQLRRTPWFLVSLGVHVLIAIVLNFISTNPTRTQVQAPLQVAPPDVAQDELDEPDVIKPDTEEIEQPEDTTDEVVVKDTEISDHVETPDDKEFEESLGDEDLKSDKPFDAMSNNDAIGLGGGGGGAFGRGRGGRNNLTTKGGGGGTPIIVDRGLQWLADHQLADGRWDCDGYASCCDPKKGPACSGRGHAIYDTGVTGLALLAFLGAGHTHRTGTYKETVRNGLKWLKSEQSPATGCFGPTSDPHFSYNHAIATLAMTEAFGMTQSGLWKGSAQNGLNYVIRMQNPYAAWRYGEKPGNNDVSVTGWMVMALKSAKISGLDVGDTAMKWAYEYVQSMTDDETGRTGYDKKGGLPVRTDGLLEQFPVEHSESMTAVGMLCRIFAGEDPKTSTALRAGAELLTRELPVWDPKGGKCDMYYWYYGSLSMFQMGGSAWKTWNPKMKEAIMPSQIKNGCAKGSWDPCGPWGEDGGRVYSTAMMVLCLEVYYRYRRVFGVK